MRVEKVKADPSLIKKFFNSEVTYKKNAQMIEAVDKCLEGTGSIPVSLNFSLGAINLEKISQSRNYRTIRMI